MQNLIYKIKYLLFLSWDWEAWCLTQSGEVIPPLPERNTAWNKGRKCFHYLGAPNNLIRHCCYSISPWVRVQKVQFIVLWLVFVFFPRWKYFSSAVDTRHAKWKRPLHAQVLVVELTMFWMFSFRLCEFESDYGNAYFYFWVMLTFWRRNFLLNFSTLCI